MTWKIGYCKYFPNNYPYVPVVFLLRYATLELVTFPWSNYSLLKEQSAPEVVSTGGS